MDESGGKPTSMMSFASRCKTGWRLIKKRDASRIGKWSWTSTQQHFVICKGKPPCDTPSQSIMTVRRGSSSLVMFSTPYSTCDTAPHTPLLFSIHSSRDTKLLHLWFQPTMKLQSPLAKRIACKVAI